jgi:hypothetical protein
LTCQVLGPSEQTVLIERGTQRAPRVYAVTRSFFNSITEYKQAVRGCRILGFSSSSYSQRSFVANGYIRITCGGAYIVVDYSS